MSVVSKYNIYNMHKYWGKKPGDEINKIIKKYSLEGDVVLDPFSGYGGTGIESIILDRNVILNDLNPSACFISKNILERNVDINKLKVLFNKLKKEYEPIQKKLFYWNDKKIISILRKNDRPTVIKYKNEQYMLSDIETKEIIEDEINMDINTYWFPEEEFIQNSRISIKKSTYMRNFFTVRTLIGNSALLDLINRLPDSNEKQLLLLAFTSNVANCSKLIPTIKSRGIMSPGSWMTGFYLPKEYVENNVFHYFENRVQKIIKGKQDFLVATKNSKSTLQIFNGDAKKLPIESSSIDLVFTDFPYGDTVPYFEQSQLWNMWLKLVPDYENEIVISNSNKRKKNDVIFANDIRKSIQEIFRVLKNNKFFVFSFHSINMYEWKSLIKPIIELGFQFENCYILHQKTLPPRQINRENSIKGDVVVVYKKDQGKPTNKPCLEFKEIFKKELAKHKGKSIEFNEIIETIVFCVLKSNEIDKIDFKKIIDDHFEYNKGTKKWQIKHFLI